VENVDFVGSPSTFVPVQASSRDYSRPDGILPTNFVVMQGRFDAAEPDFQRDGANFPLFRRRIVASQGQFANGAACCEFTPSDFDSDQTESRDNLTASRAYLVSFQSCPSQDFHIPIDFGD
jgi:hypothetical protein